jgi:uncharacterized protein YjaZ
MHRADQLTKRRNIMTDYKEEFKALQVALKDEKAKSMFEAMIKEELLKILTPEEMDDEQKVISASQDVLLKVLQSASRVIKKGQ